MKNVERYKGVNSAKIFMSDLNGRTRALQVNIANIGRAIRKGVGFDGSSISGIATVDESDKLLFPVPSTYHFLKLRRERIGVFIGKIFDADGVRSKTDPRAVLERVLANAKEKGYKFLVGPEHEFFLLTSEEYHENIHTDMAGYFHVDPYDSGDDVRRRIIKLLGDCGIKFEKTHHEVTPSQHEINLSADSPLRAADRTMFVSYVTKKVAKEHGYFATFMPKPFDGQNRNAFHIHLSMHNLAGKNVFYDTKREYNLSRTAKRFIGGILKYARETSIIMAPTVNSYKAYITEREAPVTIGWGMKNRSSMVRVPYSSRARNKRIELRNPDPSGNVYLQMATLIGMGMQGIKERLNPGEPDAGSTYKKKRRRVYETGFLPKTMFEALMEAERSKFLKHLLGKEIFNNYLALKTAEWEELRTHVTPVEHKKYLKI
jgi:glutamine synthetase